MGADRLADPHAPSQESLSKGATSHRMLGALKSCWTILKQIAAEWTEHAGQALKKYLTSPPPRGHFAYSPCTLTHLKCKWQRCFFHNTLHSTLLSARSPGRDKRAISIKTLIKNTARALTAADLALALTPALAPPAERLCPEAGETFLKKHKARLGGREGVARRREEVCTACWLAATSSSQKTCKQPCSGDARQCSH